MNASFGSSPKVSIVVPTFREAENLPLLVNQVAEVMRSRGWGWEMIVVDDNSPDATHEILDTLQRTYPQLRYRIRTNERGLSSAVLAGMGMAQHDYIVVMDADLSHPPESVPTLVEKLVSGDADFVIGSRYVPGGKTEDWTWLRWLNSAGATLLSRPLAGAVRDSMAGFFAFKRSMLANSGPLNPIGYKIGLELLVKCHAQRVVEVPITFRNRVHGESKLTLKEQFRYLEHLSRLYDYKYPKASPELKFTITAGCGVVACLGTVWGMERLVGSVFPINMALGLLAMIAVTLVFFLRYVHTQRDFIVMKHPYSEFVYISLAELLVGWFFAVSTQPSAPTALKALVGIAALLVVRYALRKLFLHDIRGIRGEPKPAATLRLEFPAAAPATTVRSASA
ncbi:MAG: polyprenol monophosphomannose synthase [Phycisphaerae bacterium]